MTEYEVRPLRTEIEEQRLVDFPRCPVMPEPFPGPISAWKKEDELVRRVNKVLFIAVGGFIEIFSQFRNVYLIGIIPNGTGLWYIIANFRITGVGLSPVKLAMCPVQLRVDT